MIYADPGRTVMNEPTTLRGVMTRMAAGFGLITVGSLVMGATNFGIYNTVPNPTTGATIIAFAMPKTGVAKLEIYDASGKRVRTILDGEVSAGLNQATWDGRDGGGRNVPPGTYFARLRAGDRMQGRKIMMVR